MPGPMNEYENPYSSIKSWSERARDQKRQQLRKREIEREKSLKQSENIVLHYAGIAFVTVMAFSAFINFEQYKANLWLAALALGITLGWILLWIHTANK